MAINISELIAKFNRTDEQIEADRIADERYAAWREESSAWETKCYNEKIDPAEFRKVRDEIDIKHGMRPTSELLS